MKESFKDILTFGKPNSLGRLNEVIEIVLSDKSNLEELYHSIFDDNPWVRMRAVDAFEKVCRVHPEWIVPYIDRIQEELSSDQQPSINWHIAQIYKQVELSDKQKDRALTWLKKLISTKNVDWIVSANCMETLAYFTNKGDFDKNELKKLLSVQTTHKSNAVVKKANKIATELNINI